MKLAHRPKRDDRIEALIPGYSSAAQNFAERPPLSRASDVALLLSSSADCAERGKALAAACVIASLCGAWNRVISVISDGNMDLEQCYNGRTALMIAAEHPAALPVLQLLISRGASCCFVGL